MFKVVLDTNVIVSGFNFEGSKPAEILDLVVSGDLSNFISAHIIEETRNILIRKFSWTEKEAEGAGFWLKAFSKLVNPKVRISVIHQDDADNRILECALEAEAHFIITGDRHLLHLQTHHNINIIAPAVFLKLIQEQAPE
ncbi:MAG: putative toxin-antitoxin system toxin component, PIN family [Desulfobaccales bacterium]